jgi:iron complex outermembrane recepter protein
MKRSGFQSLLLFGVAGAALCSPAYAQETSAPVAASDDSVTGDIIVSARRRAETLQDVPQTVNAVSSQTIERLRINNAADLTQIVPGISIEGASAGAGGFGASSSIRGVPTFLLSNASPVVQFYLNDAPTGRGPEATQSLFDISQIEVLKGPQGTLRGRSAPTGAITVTSHRPDLNEVGGFVNLSGTTRGAINAQAAVNLPIIDGVLAVRFAGVIDHSEGNGVTGANYRIDPYAKREGFRATVRFEPTENFGATVMYQRLMTHTRSFTQVFGPGNGINGPAIAAGDRLGITDRPAETEGTVDFLVGQAEWRFAGQKLAYVGSYRSGKSDGLTPSDTSNALPGIEYFQQTITPAWETSHELRLSSEERIAGIFDYVIGGFYDREWSRPIVQTNGTFLAGAFGPSGTPPVVQQPLSRYTISSLTAIDPTAVEKSVFGSITAHIGEKTELTAGGRYINFNRHDRYTVATLPAFNATAAPAAQCGFIPNGVVSTVYTGRCDVAIAGRIIQSEDRRTEFNPVIYNVSLSHKFSSDFMVYGNVGSAFRSAGPSIGITGQATLTLPGYGSIQDLVFHGQEKSTTYEVGFKASFFDKRVRLNVSAFKQKFSNFFFLTQSARFMSVSDTAAFNTYAASVTALNPAPALPSGVDVSSAEFTTDANAKVKGIDVEAAFQITPRWSLNVGYSWSKARLDNALIPCNDSNFDGAPDTGGNAQTKAQQAGGFVLAGTMIARCRSNESISRTPNWNLTVQSEYTTPISDKTSAFLRGSLLYYPKNPNASQGVVISDYAMLNLYTGVRSDDGAWEVSLFANNLLNTQQVLGINPVAVSSSADATFGRPPSGYQSISYTPRREFGLNVRYAFGSR